MTFNSQNQQHFLLELEQGIKLSNREVIHQNIPPVTSESALSFAITVAKLRAKYLEAAFTFSSVEKTSHLTDEDFAHLKLQRERFEEARNAFEALRQAIDRGYVDIV